MLNTGNATFGPRGMAYLKASEVAQQDGALKAAQNHQGNPGNTNHIAHQSVLSGLKSDADKYFSPQDKVDINFHR